MWEDPRKLERWWGPPTFPATFTRHDFVVGGESRYFMTGPAGEMPRGWWRFDAIDKPNRLEFANGLSGEDGEPAPGIEPMSGSVTFEATDGGTRMTASPASPTRPDADHVRDGHAGRHDAGDRTDRRPTVTSRRVTLWASSRNVDFPSDQGYGRLPGVTDQSESEDLWVVAGYVARRSIL